MFEKAKSKWEFHFGLWTRKSKIIKFRDLFTHQKFKISQICMKFQLLPLRTSISVPTSILCLGSKVKWKELFFSVKSQHADHILADVRLTWRRSLGKQKCYIFLGTAISHRNRKSYKASIAAGQRSSKAKLHDGHHPTFGFRFHLLHTWGTFDICSVWGYWIDGKYFYESYMSFPGITVSKLCQECPKHIPPSAYREMPLSSWRSSSHLGDSGTHNDARDLFIRLWDIFWNICPCKYSRTR